MIFMSLLIIGLRRVTFTFSPFEILTKTFKEFIKSFLNTLSYDQKVSFKSFI